MEWKKGSAINHNCSQIHNLQSKKTSSTDTTGTASFLVEVTATTMSFNINMKSIYWWTQREEIKLWVRKELLAILITIALIPSEMFRNRVEIARQVVVELKVCPLGNKIIMYTIVSFIINTCMTLYTTMRMPIKT